MQVERARYEAELAQRRYMRVDPDNRLVADSLEADWNQKLKLLADTQQECEQLRNGITGGSVKSNGEPLCNSPKTFRACGVIHPLHIEIGSEWHVC